MIEKFNNFEWHDAILKTLIVDRAASDIVQLEVQWFETDERTTIFEFNDCYGLIANMHFGFIPPDYILNARCISQSEDLQNLQNVWKKMGVNLNNLLQFQINTNSSNSEIKIFCLGYKIIEKKYRDK